MASKTELKELTLRTTKSPATGTLQITDGKVPGFGVRITYNGTRTFYFAYRFKGRPFRLNLGRYPELSLASARAKAEKARGLLRAGINPADHIDKGPDTKSPRDDYTATAGPLIFSPILSEAIDKYVRGHLKANCRPSTERETARNLRTAFNSLANTPINEITKQQIKDILQKKVHDGYLSAAVHAFKHVNGLFNWCVRNDLLAASPSAGIERPAKIGKRKAQPQPLGDSRYLARRRGRGLSHGLHHPARPPHRPAPLRSGRDEVGRTRSRQFWKLPSERTKSDRGHIVPLSTFAIEILRKIRPTALPPEPGRPYEAPSPFLFPAPKDPTRPTTWFSKPKARIAKLAKVEDWRLHDLRRTAISTFGVFRIDYKVKQKILNHADSNVTDIYDQNDHFEPCCEAMHRWAQFLRKAIAGEIKELHDVRKNPYVNGDPDEQAQAASAAA